MKKTFLTFILFSLSVLSFGQKLTINKAILDRRIVDHLNDEVLVEGTINIEYEIYNNTRDTIYLFNRGVEPFLDEKPFQIVQTQTSIEKFSKDCKGRFIYNQPPSSYYFKKLNIKEDITIIPPKGKEKMSIRNYVDEGFCPLMGKKIELKLIYNVILSNYSKSETVQKIEDVENALKILQNHKETISTKKLIQGRTQYISELNNSIEQLINEIKYLKDRNVEFDYLSKHSFTKIKMESNSVYVNE